MAILLGDVQKFAVSLAETTIEPHFDKTSIRVCGKIFVTLANDIYFIVKLNLDDQSVLTDMFSDNFMSTKGWGKYGWTEVKYEGLKRDLMEDVVIKAWIEVAPKRLSNPK